MTDRYIYHRDEFENDCVFFISEDLYEARTENGSACGKSAMPPEFRWSK